MRFIDWLKGDLGTPGEYQYTLIYWITLLCVIIITSLAIYLAKTKRISDNNKAKILKGIAIFHLIFEVLWRIIFLTVKQSRWVDMWPMYPCNLGGILLPIICLIDNKTLKKIFYLFGFVGAILTFALPAGIFSSNVLIFPILKSILQHTGLLLIPAFEYAWNKFRPSLKDYLYLVIGILIHLINAEVIDRLLGLEEDYMFFRSGMPFVIPGVPQFITFSVFGLICFGLISFVCDIKTSVSLFKKIGKKDE